MRPPSRTRSAGILPHRLEPQPRLAGTGPQKPDPGKAGEAGIATPAMLPLFVPIDAFGFEAGRARGSQYFSSGTRDAAEVALGGTRS